MVIPTFNRKNKITRLIQSILKTDYPNEQLQIIVIDDFSNDGTYIEIQKKFPNVEILRNKKEQLVSASRNFGLKKSKGDFILFVDDDNVVSSGMLRLLIEYMEKHENVGVCAPLMLYYGTSTIWCAGIKRNMITSRTVYLFNQKKLDKIKLLKVIKSDDFPNCFLVRTEILRKYGILFDEILFPINYEESDFCYRIKNLGYQIVCYTGAIVWHDVSRNRGISFKTQKRTYYSARNRILFHKKYSKRIQFLLFTLIFNWVFTSYYIYQIMFDSNKPGSKKIITIRNYLKGVKDGLHYA